MPFRNHKPSSDSDTADEVAALEQRIRDLEAENARLRADKAREEGAR